MTQEPEPTEAQEPVPPLPSAAVEPSRDKAPLDPTFGWFDLAQAQVACAVSGISRLAGCHTLGDVAASQSDFFRESVQLMVDHSLRLVDRAQEAIDLERA
jgi:hypothetical protein